MVPPRRECSKRRAQSLVENRATSPQANAAHTLLSIGCRNPILFREPRLFATGGLAADSILGAANGGIWEWAVDGNTGANGVSAVQNYTGTFASLIGGGSLADFLGSFGFDPDAGGTGVGGVWAVVDYGSVGGFAAIPEPTSALAGLLIGAGLLRRRRI